MKNEIFFVGSGGTGKSTIARGIYAAFTLDLATKQQIQANKDNIVAFDCDPTNLSLSKELAPEGRKPEIIKFTTDNDSLEADKIFNKASEVDAKNMLFDLSGSSLERLKSVAQNQEYLKEVMAMDDAQPYFVMPLNEEDKSLKYIKKTYDFFGDAVKYIIVVTPTNNKITDDEAVKSWGSYNTWTKDKEYSKIRQDILKDGGLEVIMKHLDKQAVVDRLDSSESFFTLLTKGETTVKVQIRRYLERIQTEIIKKIGM